MRKIFAIAVCGLALLVATEASANKKSCLSHSGNVWMYSSGLGTWACFGPAIKAPSKQASVLTAHPATTGTPATGLPQAHVALATNPIPGNPAANLKSNTTHNGKHGISDQGAAGGLISY